MITGAKFVHTNIISENWEKLARFYEDVFGCSRVLPERDMSGDWIEEGTGVSDVRIRGAHLRLPGYGDEGPSLEIFQYNKWLGGPIKKINEVGIVHIAFRVDNVNVALAEVISHGGGRIGKTVTKYIEGVGTLTFVYATDPDGNIIELQNWKR
ncbi:MAG: VOC family protein [Spirochaetes bacterium]|nr:VOC family protein [Spirochaetota bacterium]